MDKAKQDLIKTRIRLTEICFHIIELFYSYKKSCQGAEWPLAKNINIIFSSTVLRDPYSTLIYFCVLLDFYPGLPHKRAQGGLQQVKDNISYQTQLNSLKQQH